MNSTNIKASPLPKGGQGGFPAVGPTSQAILLDKLNARRSTPDSEALASSDDEVDPHRQEPLQNVSQPQKPIRRASWLNDTSQPAARPRKGSFASSSMSPTTSHPSTPSAEVGAAAWGSHSASSAALGRGHSGSASFPWGTAIWNPERKEAPTRLTEVLPSPTSALPTGTSSSSFFSESTTSPASKEHGPTSQIPFPIPLHPTPKTYRSQSYSVGQLESDALSASLGSSAIMGGRARPGAHSGLQHRPSRPSMLSEMSNDSSMLGKVNEDDDDDDSTSSMQGSMHKSAEAKTIELLARENAMLRQQQQYQSSRLRPRASTGYGFQDPVPEESDYAIDELDEANDGPDGAIKRALGRRLSEFNTQGSGAYRTPYMVENRKLENVKKATWQTSPFPGIEGPQSRRHSFADMPTRQGSISSISETGLSHEPGSFEQQQIQDYSSPYETGNFGATNPSSAYFGGAHGMGASQQAALAQSVYGGQFPSPYGLPAQYANRPPSPHRGLYGVTQPRHNQLLHIVTFKCSRADVFYIQEGTGLTVKPGDLVIVEADRGTDLGTVQKDNVDWQSAKELKEHFAEEHYKWLMMYSQNAAAAHDGVGAGLMAASNGLQGSAVGGMGPPNQHHMQEPNSGELKPKLIKRLAQSHEIYALKDKEGNEAKAKRVCMQKVKEHGLNMEILDAEFQMDWKKLTFYYFADSYINFNSLVTDLFKIYKTRIWMSAINPASFASPTLGLQAPSGIGPGAVVGGRSLGTSERRQNQQQDPQSGYTGAGQANRALSGAAAQAFSPDRAVVASSAYPQSNFPFNTYNPFGAGARAGGLPYPGVMPAPIDAYPAGFAGAGDMYAGGRGGRFPTPQSANGPEGISPLTTQGDWAAQFQGLSLNTR